MKNILTILFSIISLPIFAQNESEPNDNFSTANPITLSTNWQGEINVSNDKDYYKFNISEPGILKLVATSVPGDVFLRGHIYTPDMVERRKGTSGLGQGFQMEVSTCDIGEHFLLLYNASSADNSSEDPYFFRLEFTPFSQVDNCECQNQSFNQACQINTGQTVNALIAPVFDDNPFTEDEDFYKFNISEPGIIKLVVTSVPGDVFLRGHIYTPDMIERRKGTSSLGQGYQMEVSTCEVGEHFLQLYNASSADNFNSEEQYSFRVEFTPFSLIDNCECENQSFNQACLISTNETIDAIIAPVFDDNPFTEDDDFYKFDIPEPGVLKLVVTSVPGDVFLRSHIYTPDMLEIRKETSSLGQGFQMEVSTCEVGEHFLQLYNASSADNFNSEEQYSFRVEFTPFSLIDNCECNNSFNNACQIGICDTVVAVIAPWFDDNSVIADKDIYQIELTSLDEVSIDISSVSPNIKICASIYDQSQSLIDNYFGNTGQALNFDFITPNDGFYYLEVKDCSGNFNSESQYELTIGCDLVNNTKDLNLKEIAEVFPNPYSESFNIQFNHAAHKESEIVMYDILGSPVFSQKNINTENLQIQTEYLPKGIYILRLRIENNYYSAKVMKN